MKKKYQSLSAVALKDLAKARGLKGVSLLRKDDLIEVMLKEDEKVKEQEEVNNQVQVNENQEQKSTDKNKEAADNSVKDSTKRKLVSSDAHISKKPKKSYYTVDRRAAMEEQHNVVLSQEELDKLDSGYFVQGFLEVMPDGYGFIRSHKYMAGDHDVYVSPTQIKRFNLRTGDIVAGNVRVNSSNEKFSALLFVSAVNNLKPEHAYARIPFEKLTPIFPNKRLHLEQEGSSVAMRVMDLVSPVGKGQRGMIVAPPKAGKTTLMKEVALSIKNNNPGMYLMILLIDERPEEVTDIREALEGENVEVVYSTFDEKPENHKRLAEMVVERAKRLVESGLDVTILLDSITRLSRAYNLTVPPSGRTLSGGLDPAALHMPKKFFGAARNMRESGSLTILATALVDTGSRMDDVVYEEFKGTGNMELVLDRNLQERRIFPALDIPKSGTRREDLLLSPEELKAVNIIRKAMNGMKQEEAVDNLLNMFNKTKTNKELVERINTQKFI